MALTKRDRIIRLAGSGYDILGIIEAMRDHPHGPPTIASVKTVLSQARKRGAIIAYSNPMRWYGRLNDNALHRAARRRGIDVRDLISRLLLTIAREPSLVDAILDDAVARGEGE